MLSPTLSIAILVSLVALSHADVAVTCDTSKRLSAGTTMTCAVQAGQGSQICWGHDARTSDCPGIENMHSPAEAANAPPPRFSEVSTGYNHACGLTLWNSVRCWGVGVVADTVEGYYSTLSSSRYVNCAIYVGNNTLRCWGDPDVHGRDLLTLAPTLIPVNQVSLARTYACVVRISDSMPQCWPDVSTLSPVPAKVVTTVKAGEDFACALDAERRLVCWTSVYNASTPNYAVISAQKYYSSTEFLQISVGRNFGCGVTLLGGQILCWAQDGHSIYQDIPSSNEGGEVQTFVSLEAGGTHACAVRSNFSVYCWPKNDPNGATQVPDGLVLCPADDYTGSGDSEFVYTEGYSGGSLAIAMILSIIAGVGLDRLLLSGFVREKCGLRNLIAAAPNIPTPGLAARKRRAQSNNDVEYEEDDDIQPMAQL